MYHTPNNVQQNQNTILYQTLFIIKNPGFKSADQNLVHNFFEN